MGQMARAPNITRPELTSPHEDHPPYTEETLKRAITQGLEPDGYLLDIYMPSGLSQKPTSMTW